MTQPFQFSLPSITCPTFKHVDFYSLTVFQLSGMWTHLDITVNIVSVCERKQIANLFISFPQQRVLFAENDLK